MDTSRRTAGVVETVKPREKRSSLSRFINFIVALAFGLPTQLIILGTISLLAAGLLADQVYPNYMETRFGLIAQSVATRFNAPPVSNLEMMQAISRHNLAWLYITNRNGRIDQATKPFAPDLKIISLNSRNIQWRERPYYEAVVPLRDGSRLHLGFLLAPFMLNASQGIDSLLFAPTPSGYFILWAAFLLAFIIIFCYFRISKPLWHLAHLGPKLFKVDDQVLDRELKVPGAVTEVQEIANLFKEIRHAYDHKLFVSLTKEHELKREKQTLEHEHVMLAKEFKEHLFDTHKNISELSTKELEDELLSGLAREIDALISAGQIGQKILEKLNDKFPQTITYGAVFMIERGKKLKLQACLGLEDNAREMLEANDHQGIAQEVFSSGKALIINSSHFGEYRLLEFAGRNSLKTLTYFPLSFNNRQLGLFAIYFDSEGKQINERQRILRNVADLAARSLYRVVIYQEELEAARTDALTGLHNKKYLYEIAPQLIKKAANNPAVSPVSLLMIDGDNFKGINDVYGHQTGDLLLQELAESIRQNTRHQDDAARSRGPKDYLARFGGEEFVVILEGSNANVAMVMAERLRKSIAEKVDWPGGVATFTVSIGVATFPGDGDDVHKLLHSADTALHYVKNELGKNKCCLFAQVPRNFKSEKWSVMEGDLGVFDPSALLQSLANAQKTGILTVKHQDGRQLWALFEGGKATQARLGKLGGADALVEFVSTFEEGAFNFQEKGLSKESTSSRILLEDRCTVKKALDRCLLDAAFAQDNLTMARQHLPTSELTLLPVDIQEYRLRWQNMLEQPDHPEQDEIDLMISIIRLADQSTTLRQMFEAMDEVPTWLLWRAAARLVSNELVEVRLPSKPSLKIN